MTHEVLGALLCLTAGGVVATWILLVLAYWHLVQYHEAEKVALLAILNRDIDEAAVMERVKSMRVEDPMCTGPGHPPYVWELGRTEDGILTHASIMPGQKPQPGGVLHDAPGVSDPFYADGVGRVGATPVLGGAEEGAVSYVEDVGPPQEPGPPKRGSEAPVQAFSGWHCACPKAHPAYTEFCPGCETWKPMEPSTESPPAPTEVEPMERPLPEGPPPETKPKRPDKTHRPDSLKEAQNRG